MGDDFEQEALGQYYDQYAGNPYTQDLGTPIEPTDNETAKLLRQQAIAGSGESPLAGMGPGAQSFDLTNLGDSSGFSWDKVLNNLKSFGSSAANFASTPQGLMALLMALANYSSRRKPSGGGGTQAFKMPTAPQTRTITQGKYGPIARYAADGGLMHAYAHGGHVRMEDGGFVMTKRAV